MAHQRFARSSCTSLLFAFAFVGGCGDKKDDTAPADAKGPAVEAKAKPEAKADAKTDIKAEAKAEPPAADEPIEIPDPGAPGPAYFAVKDKGIYKLDAGTFTQVQGGPDKFVKQLLIGPDGAPYVLGFDAIVKIVGDKAEVVAKTEFKTTGSVDAFTVTKDGQIWAVGFKGISHFEGGKWTVQDKTVLGSDVQLLKGVAVDAQGLVWVASSNALHVREGDAWKLVDLSQAGDRKPFFNSLAVGPDNLVYAVASTVMLKLASPTAIVPIDLGQDGFTSFDNLAYASNGVGALQTKPDAVLLMTPGGGKREFVAAKDFTSDRIVAVAVDGRGRTWIATDEGVAIVGPADQKVEWKSGSVEQLAGQVEEIAIVGAGPELPEVGPVKKAGIKGKILADGKGLATADIEMCPKPDAMFETSPCADSSTKFTGKTDADGNFEFKDVPLGAYGIAVKVGDKWQITFGSEFGTKMKEGETLDIGSITVKAS